MDGSYKRGGNSKQLNVLGGDLEPCRSSKDENEITLEDVVNVLENGVRERNKSII